MKNHLSPAPVDFQNHLIRGVMENAKTHAESREFRAHGDNGQRFETALSFVADIHNQEFAPYPLAWNVEQGNKTSARSFSSRLVAGALGRIRGLDAQAPGVTFRYQKETGSSAFWHENQISFDKDGVVRNRHQPLPDWPESFPGPNAFARRVATQWKIETWRDGEAPSLFNLDEVSP